MVINETEQFADVLAHCIHEATAPLIKRIAALEDQAKSQPQFKYWGVWHEGKTFGPGDFVTHGGSLWHANLATQSRPGSTRDWQLAVKCGRDGKDGRDAT